MLTTQRLNQDGQTGPLYKVDMCDWGRAPATGQCMHCGRSGDTEDVESRRRLRTCSCTEHSSPLPHQQWPHTDFHELAALFLLVQHPRGLMLYTDPGQAHLVEGSSLAMASLAAGSGPQESDSVAVVCVIDFLSNKLFPRGRLL
eukprot:scaffold289311_cov37-Tisochrysis_lutea.AAC.1